MVVCGLAGRRGASLGGRGEGGTVGARIRGLGVSGWRGGGVLGPIPSGGGGVGTRNTGPYIDIHTCIYIIIYIYIKSQDGCFLHLGHRSNRGLSPVVGVLCGSHPRLPCLESTGSSPT